MVYPGDYTKPTKKYFSKLFQSMEDDLYRAMEDDKISPARADDRDILVGRMKVEWRDFGFSILRQFAEELDLVVALSHTHDGVVESVVREWSIRLADHRAKKSEPVLRMGDLVRLQPGWSGRGSKSNETTSCHFIETGPNKERHLVRVTQTKECWVDAKYVEKVKNDD